MKKYILSLFLCGLIIPFINSCKSDPKPVGNGNASAKTTSVTIRQYDEVKSLNVLLVLDGVSLQVCNYLFPTLLAYDPFTYELSPVLVKSRPVVEEITSGKRKGWATYTYELLEEATWDDGVPITAKDYLFTIKTIFNPHVEAAAYRGYMKLIKDVELDPANPKKFTVYTSEKYINAEYATGLFIYPEHLYDSKGLLSSYDIKDIRNPKLAKQHKEDETLKAFGTQFNSPEFAREKANINGCGAYQLEEWVEGDKLVLSKKEDWWGTPLKDKYPMLTANPERIIFKPIKEATTALTMMKNEEIDVMSLIKDDLFIAFKESSIGKEKFDTYTPPYLGYSYYGLNTQKPKLSDKRTRKALAHLVDMEEVIKSVKPFAEQVVGPFHPTRSYYNKNLKPKKLDVEKAKTLLAEAGWKDSNNNGVVDKMIDGALTELELELLMAPNNPIGSSMALIFQKEAIKAGVKIAVSEKGGSALKDQLRIRDFDMFSLVAGADMSMDDPYQYWHTASDKPNGSNRFGFGNAATDKIIEDLRSELDEEKRKALYFEFQEILYEEQPAIFLYATLNRIAVNKKFKGFKTSPKKPGFFANYWYE